MNLTAEKIYIEKTVGEVRAHDNGKKTSLNLIGVAPIVSSKGYQNVFRIKRAQNQTQTLW